ncbi:hypothetical protein ACQ4LE_009451 [Meloidogyne hapla]
MPSIMGTCLCRHENDKNHTSNLQCQNQHLTIKAAPSSKGVGLGISMMMHQAGMLAGCAPTPHLIDLNNLRSQMRKAKAEGRTVTVINGCVYIDYQLKAQIPAGFNYDM